ncbi:MAG: hypothetical protein AAF907_04735, partial [Planctomycetota bacterium]
APEVARGQYGRGVDIYALAVMLFEMYTGTVPFDGETPAEILMKHLSAPPDLSPLPPALKPVFARALHKDPDKRTKSVADLERQFRAAVRGQQTDAEPVDLEPASFGAPVAATPAVARREVRREVRPAAAPQPVPAPAPADSKTGWVQWTVIGLLVLLVLQPGAFRVLTASMWEMAILGALGYGVYRVVKWLGGAGDTAATRRDNAWYDHEQQRLRERTPSSSTHRSYAPTYVPHRQGDKSQPESRQPSPGNAPPGAVPVRQVAREVRPAKYARPAPRPIPYSPEDARPLSGWRRTTEFAGSAAVAGTLSAGLAGLLYLTEAVRTVPETALFGLVLALTSWGVLLTGKLTEGRFGPESPRKWLRRLPTLAVGAGAGAGAWALAEGLLVDFPLERDSIWAEIVGRSRGPEVIAVSLIGFFAWTLGVRRWWRHVDGYRPKRLRIRTVLMTALAGFAGCVIFGVPMQWGMPWALGLSIVTQIAAVWTPGRKRPHRVPVMG